MTSKVEDFQATLPISPGLGLKLSDGSISLKFFLETSVDYNPSLFILWMT